MEAFFEIIIYNEVPEKFKRKGEKVMFIKIRGIKAGMNGEGEFIVNTESIKSIEVLLAENKIMYLFDDPKGITIKDEDFNRLCPLLDIKDCTAESN